MSAWLARRGLFTAGSITTIAIAAGVFAYSSVPDLHMCNGWPMTAAQAAAYRGIDLDTFEQLHAKRSVDIPQLCDMPQKKLERAIWRIGNPKPDQPGEWAKLRHRQSVDANGRIPADALMKARADVDAMRAAQRSDRDAEQISRTSWTWIGPGNIGGRIRSILIHPTTPLTMYLGSVSGGIWKTTNGGLRWDPLDDFMANVAVSTMVMDRNDPDVIYAGTGEGFFNIHSITGAGIFKTTDGGATWKRLPSTATVGFQFVNRLAISANNGILLAATGAGIYRSTNGGVSWSKELNGRVLDVRTHPTNYRKAVAGGENGNSWYSTDGGLSWVPSAGLSGAGRVELAYAPSSPNIVYASVDFNSGTIYKSTDGGQSFAQVHTGSAYLGGQGWYDNAIWVDPTEPNIVVVGGIDLWRTTNGGPNLSRISQWFSAPQSAHADHHVIAHHPGYNGTTNRIVFFGNDGGIYKTANVRAVSLTKGWRELNNNLGITQFYGAAGNPTTREIIGGTQDNGTLFFKPGAGPQKWTSPFGGDGGFSAADPTDPNYFYGEYTQLQIHRSTDRGVSSSYIFNGISDSASCALFIAPFILDPNNANRMLAGGCSLWRSNNVKAATPAWKAIKAAAGGMISAIAVAQGNSDVIWVGHDNGDIYRTSNGTAANPTWTKVDGASLPDRYVTRITIKDSSTVYVTFGGYTTDNVWRTTNGTAAAPTFSSIHGNLPDVPVRSLVVHPDNANFLYVGTEVGVFLSINAGASWIAPDRGPTHTSVDELFFLGTTIHAVTHGRGVFKSETLPLLASPNVIADADRPETPAN